MACVCRRQGLAKQLMDHLESVTERDEGFFVDLFVRESNVNAINMYKKVRCDACVQHLPSDCMACCGNADLLQSTMPF